MERAILKCSRCRSLGHTVENCRARCDIFTKQPLESDTPPKKQVYVLECQDSCFYVGVTDDLQKRFLQHQSGEATEWTRRHPPIRYIPTFTNVDLYQINAYSCQEQDEFYACLYNLGGLAHVRGWLYSDANLSARDCKQIEQQVAAHFDLCYKCGYASHISGECYAITKAAWKQGEIYKQIKSVFDV